MRISSGQLKGRIFEAPKGHTTHPMGDRVRSGLFNTLGDIEDLSVLDAFAGSGALSFEALSRGAGQAVAIENDRTAQMTIEQNAKQLGLQGSFKLIKASAEAWLRTTTDSFDLVLLDPPYNHISKDLLSQLLKRTKVGGLAVISLPPKEDVNAPENFLEVSTKNYGDACLHFLRRES